MIVRHAEKPRDSIRGVTESGVESKHDLTVRGWQRAGAWACLFAANTPNLTRPQFLFASAPAKENAESFGAKPRSKRSIDTLLPLSRRLNLAIDTSFTKGQEREVAEAAQRCPGAVLIAWQHESINAIVQALPGSHRELPLNWPEERFDMIYVLDLDATPGEYRFAQQPQCLLDGDIDAPFR